MKKYIILTVLFFLLFSPILSERLSKLDKILSTKTIVVGIDTDNPPFFIQNPQDGHPGFDIEFIQLYADYLHVTIRFVITENLQDLFAFVDTGKVDIGLGGISSTLERGKKVSFSKSYLVTTPAALISRSLIPPENEGNIPVGTKMSSLNDIKVLAGLVFSVKSGTTNENFLKRNFEKSNINTFDTNEQALTALKENNANVFVADSLYIQALLQKNPELNGNYIPLLQSVMSESIAVVLPKNDITLIYDINFFISEMIRTGQIAELKNKYFNSNTWVKKD